MIVYHGSNVKVSKPDINHSRKSVDFGRGFYVTPLLEQAESWCKRIKSNNKNAYVSSYSFDETAFSQLKVLKFDSYSDDWLDFIMACRSGNDNSDYDIVMGGIANDKVFNTVELYFDGLIDKEVAIKRLKYENPNYQIAFKTQNAIDNYLKYEGSVLYDG